ncbi:MULTISPECIES: hypothetical protein [Streptomyces]|uniref:Uncharacterized protein n=1 Tax=Streptomyces tsukubensis (strain DSM 42081 / NBRC 108919 / NRRL 18488 / 9993) TaxID=1114943 RepID=I2N4N6_STRT9|nr:MULTISPECIES: hypothetical protein [Streptomyces]AZK96027.1 hypothetical protein B7R87_20785 [Streptomyces tsukubensis]EIF91983.1 LPXTG-motif cell wall anchor domain protein [Streptomyces tsukubensis NRRL18488]MYS65060.1 hypothetical protein [Streptomyces sp. SID5473]QKM67950.1 hypothetical protein STSU_012995 [Streptomyces tsukubensis NRRL18488]TAI44348.1 hypothetical protein EWI31_12795 [Streptomyces tsukubensis]
MKLRRAAAFAAASAVLAPLALLSAPAALATGVTDPASTTGTSTPGTPESDPAKDPATDPAKESAGQQGGAAGETRPEAGGEGEGEGQGEQKPAEPQTGGEKPEGGEPGTAPGNGQPPGTTPDSGKPPKNEEEGEEGGVDECATEVESKDLKTNLRGLPSKVVAGSGWQNFSYRVTNDSKKAMESVTAYLLVEAYTHDYEDETLKYVTLQAKYNGAWEKFDVEEGYLGDTEKLDAGEYAELELRLKVDGKAPAGVAFLMTLGVHVDEKNNCEYGKDVEYGFEILPAGSKPSGGDAEGKPGKGKPDKTGKPGSSGGGTEPQGGRKDVPVTGNLAATGSSDALPVIGITGGVAVLAGAGVVFALKRRRGDATA